MHLIKRFLCYVVLVGLFIMSGCANANPIIGIQPSVKKDSLSYKGYTLEQVVVLSRHNIRSPLSGDGSSLDTITPHKWLLWSSDPSDLSLRGGVLETEMGQYFRKWLEEEGLFPEDYLPGEEVRIYANSKQRTIATANFFKTGLLPISDYDVEYHAKFDEMDPVFNPKFTFMSEKYKNDVLAQLNEMFDKRIHSLEDNYILLGKVIDVNQSEDYKEGKFTGFSIDDTEYVLEKNSEPGMKGSLKLGCSISDALVLQYYEADNKTAAFGKVLSLNEWERITEIKDTYQDVLFTAPLIAINVANPLLKEILAELNTKSRKFTFLCGHDSNLGSVLTALQVQDYNLPDSIEKKTPIGSKVVFARWRGKDGKQYISVDMVYQTTEQLRGLALLDTDNPPSVVQLKLNGIEQNEDGLYDASAVIKRFEEAIKEYDNLKNAK